MWEVSGWRLKVYGITCGPDAPEDDLIEAAKAAAGTFLDEEIGRHETYGVGFLGVHQGATGNQIFLDRWANDNELLHEVWISSSDRPTDLTPAPRDHNSVCVWDLRIQSFERQAWIDLVLSQSEAPDFEAYLSERCNEDA
jgi:hypothetical protein